ncbi:hypothetical protein PMA3_26730 [Pseudomonas silesiensis]|uniref:Uncharacterized protein n=2 Tax=Pseudomonas silesiensis TaxID=1853130 RepID=A0A191Z080_9PSED|nr:hypothetical protein PMA3_26730 [Pseudomonas silesiensis]
MLFLPLLPQEISTLDAERISIKVGRVLRGVFKEFWPDELYSGFRKRVEKIIDAQDIGSDEIASCYWNAGEAVEHADTFMVGFFFASLYYLSSLKALKLEDENKALTLLTYASYHLGFVDGYQDFTRHAEITIKGPSSGGRANKRIREMVSEYLVGLLSDSPSEGWKTQVDTAEKLCEKLDGFIVSNRFGKVVPNAENFIKFALRAKGVPRDTYLLKMSKHR